MAEEKETEDFARMLDGQESRERDVQMGQKIKGKIISVSGDDVFLDLGLKQDGIMDRKDLINADGESIAGEGDEVEAFVTGVSPQGIKVSRSISGAGMAALEDALASQAPVNGRILGACKGGYNVEILGKTAFCPGSQMEYLAEGEDPTGRRLPFIVMRVENRGKNIVVSHRALKDREKKENLDKLLSSINIGDIVEGRVARIVPFGAFIELAPGVEGMAHISELSFGRPASPEEVVAEGDKINVKILSIGEDDKKRLRISLSARQAMEDPWKDAEKKFKPGETAEGIVRRLAPFGAFVELAPGIEGLVHLSEMSWEKRVNKADEILAVGDRVNVKIKDIDPESRRISLSLKDALGDPWREAAEKLAPGAVVKGTVESKGPHGIFINLMPGVVGLMPNSTIKNSPQAAKLSKAEPGDEIEAAVQKVDPQARRVSLAPPKETGEEEEAAKNWRENAKTAAPAKENNGIMAQALKRAFAKKGVSKE